MVLVYWQCSVVVTTDLESFYHPPQKTHNHWPVTPRARSPLCSWQPLICFPSHWICLFWVFHMNRIVQYVAFCDWLLALSMFWGSSMLHMHQYFIPFHSQILSSCTGVPSSMYPFPWWWMFELFPCILLSQPIYQKEETQGILVYI